MVKGALVDIVEQVQLDSIWAHTVDEFAKSNCFMDVLARQVVESTFINTTIPAFVNKLVDKIVKRSISRMHQKIKLTNGRWSRFNHTV